MTKISRNEFIKLLSDELKEISDGELLMIANIVGVDADCKVHGEFEIKNIDWKRKLGRCAKICHAIYRDDDDDRYSPHPLDNDLDDR